MDDRPQPRVLDVGQCDFDHARISRMLADGFNARVDRAHDADAAREAVTSGAYDLVLINRLLDVDGSEGTSLIQRLLADDATRDTPVMLVSNYPDAQEDAERLGAEPGFGKDALDDTATLELLAPLLSE